MKEIINVEFDKRELGHATLQEADADVLIQGNQQVRIIRKQ